MGFLTKDGAESDQVAQMRGAQAALPNRRRRTPSQAPDSAARARAALKPRKRQTVMSPSAVTAKSSPGALGRTLARSSETSSAEVPVAQRQPYTLRPPKP